MTCELTCGAYTAFSVQYGMCGRVARGRSGGSSVARGAGVELVRLFCLNISEVHIIISHMYTFRPFYYTVFLHSGWALCGESGDPESQTGGGPRH